MILSKKYNTTVVRFVLFLTMTGAVACGPEKLRNTAIEGKKIAINGDLMATQAIDDYIKPYREHVDKDLDSVLAYSPETLDKGKSIGGWQTTIGNLMADVTFEKADKVFMAREQRHVDVCLLNHGGIRSVIAKGNVTTRTAFEIMPFEITKMVFTIGPFSCDKGHG